MKVDIQALHEAYEKHQRNVGRRARRWLKDWVRAWLTQHTWAESICVEVFEDEEHPGITDVLISVEGGGPDFNSNADADEIYPFSDVEDTAHDYLWPWGHYLRLAVGWGGYVRVHQGGKVYRNKRKKEKE